MSDCAFGVDLAATSLDPTIETMIEFTVGKDATISENLHSSFSANYTIGAQLFKTPTAPVGVISTSTTSSNLSKPTIDDASTFAIGPTAPTTPTISPIVGNEHDETLGK